MRVSEALAIALHTLRPAAKAIPIAGACLDGVLEVIDNIITLIREADVIDDAVVLLVQREAALSLLVSDMLKTAERGASERFADHVKELHRVLKETGDYLNQQHLRRLKPATKLRRLRRSFSRLAESGRADDSLQQLNRRIDNVAQSFQLHAALEQMLKGDQLSTKIDEILERQRTLEALNKADMNRLLQPVHDATSFSEQAPHPCLPGTREDILQELSEWALSDSYERVVWLSGLAGTGKSSIARTICDVVAAHSQNAASTTRLISFFVARDSADRRNPRRILHTIIYQLCRALPAFDDFIRRIVDDRTDSDSDLLARPLAEQFARTLTTFFVDNAAHPVSFLLVVDGFDEADRSNGVEGGDLLPALLRLVQSSSTQMRLLLTSRKSHCISDTMAQLPSLSLRRHELLLTDTEPDIRHFLSHEFERIAKRCALPDWPSKEDLDCIVSQSQCLFIYAATVIRFVDNDFGPRNRLQAIVDPEFVSTVSSPGPEYYLLDLMYTHVLLSAIPPVCSIRERRAIAALIRRVLGALVLAQEHLSISAITSLLRTTNARAISHALTCLSAVLLIDSTVRVYHDSFRDFLLDPNRCNNDLFCLASDGQVTIAGRHRLLLVRCLEIMNTTLCEDMCQLGDAGEFNLDPMLASNFLSEELRYASRHWVTHLSDSSLLSQCTRIEDTELLGLLGTFLRQHVLHWIEATSLLGNISGLRDMLDLYRGCQDHGPRTACYTITTYIDDIRRFLTLFDAPISSSALQSYRCAACFAPASTVFKVAVQHSRYANGLSILSPRAEMWSRLILKTAPVREGVSLVTASHDGRRLVSSHGDRSLRIWDTSSGECLSVLVATSTAGDEANTGNLYAMAYSSEGHVAATATQQDISVWDLRTKTRRVCLGTIYRVVALFLPRNGSRLIVLGASDNAQQMGWLANISLTDPPPDGAVVVGTEFGHHLETIDSGTISSSGNTFAFGSMSYPFATHVWRTRGFKRIATLKGHTDSVTCIAFTDDSDTCSPTSVLVATGSADQTARIWCAIDQRVLAVFNQHEDCVVSVAWTPDAKMLASASWDNTVRLWCLTSHACLAVLPHGARVLSLCFVPSSGRRGSVLLTGCDDASLRLWDAERTDSDVIASAIEGPVERVVFSKDCCFLATISGDTIAVWRPRSHRPMLFQYEGHHFNDLQFSPDNAVLVASGTFPGLWMWRRVVEGWTRSSRALQQSTTATRLSGIAFSAKGDTVVSYSAERIHLDEGESGRRIVTMDRHGNAPVSVVAFSHTDRHIAEVDEHGNLRVWVINEARDEMVVRYQSAPLLYALLRSPLWLRFTPDSNHILCGNDQWHIVEFRLPAEPSQDAVAKLEQVWPLSKKHIPSHFGWKEGDDAWLWYQSKGRRERRTRVCWLPGDRRPNAVGPEKEKVYAWSGNVVAIGASNGTLTILRVNKSKNE